MRLARAQRTTMMMALIAGTLWVLLPATRAQQNQLGPVPQSDTCTVDADGTAHITRVIPVPETKEALDIMARFLNPKLGR